MCGIVGVVGQLYDQSRYARMSSRLRHRGPDSHGEWNEGDVWLAHRRLAILDLSPAGHQPMHSQCGRFVLTFNGEIYNFRALRAELESEGFAFRGSSDTEVILVAASAWGVEPAVRRLEGMFAFGLYDRAEKIFWLARDPMGIKPLYYCCAGNLLAFSSELHPMLELPWVNPEIDQDALFSYFRYGYVPAPASILKQIRKLGSGQLARFSNGTLQISTYWNLAEVARSGVQGRNNIEIGAAADLLDSELRNSVREHMQSDVPYGAFLSGGIDSSVVVALMQAESVAPVKTFSLGFSERSHDESVHAKSVAKYLGTEHHELILNAAEIPSLVPEVIPFFDEPFADNSAVPTFLVSRFASEHVKVCLSGDGGDELFGGYPRYYWAKRIEMLRAFLTPVGARTVSAGLELVPANFWDRVVDPVTRYRYSGSEGLSHRVGRFARYLRCTRVEVYPELASYCADPSRVLGYPSGGRLGPDAAEYSDLTWAEEMMLIDQLNFLQDDVLVKLDRASMAVSIEARVPLLTRPLVELSWKFSPQLKFDNSADRGKRVLREVLSRYLPLSLVERPKQGFGMPVGAWLRSPLRDWAEDLLHPASLENCGLNADVVRLAWHQHLAGQNHQSFLWTVLMYRQWHHRVFGR